MIDNKYLEQIKVVVNDFLDDEKQSFIFGSSLKKDHFGDIDIAVMGGISIKEIDDLKTKFKNSALPYKIDIINLDKVNKDFKENILNNEILWIKH